MFHNFRAYKTVNWWVLCCLETSIRWFHGFQVVKCSFRKLNLEQMRSSMVTKQHVWSIWMQNSYFLNMNPCVWKERLHVHSTWFRNAKENYFRCFYPRSQLLSCVLPTFDAFFLTCKKSSWVEIIPCSRAQKLLHLATLALVSEEAFGASRTERGKMRKIQVSTDILIQAHVVRS